jgi:predicted ATP-grasp superfamily ATP-dependent carboligase
MKEFDTSTPVVVLNAKMAALGIMRSLGKKGVKVYGVDSDPKLPALRSRFCAGNLLLDLTSDDHAELVNRLLEFGRSLGGRAVLFWTSDETAVLCTEHQEELSEVFLMPRNDPRVIDGLQDKSGMYRMAIESGIPVPHTDFPQSMEDARRVAEQASYPIMLKGIIGSRLLARIGRKMQFAFWMRPGTTSG